MGKGHSICCRYKPKVMYQKCMSLKSSVSFFFPIQMYWKNSLRNVSAEPYLVQIHSGNSQMVGYSTMEHLYRNLRSSFFLHLLGFGFGWLISPTSLPSVGFIYILALDVLLFVYLHCVSSILTCCVLYNKHPLPLSTKECSTSQGLHQNLRQSVQGYRALYSFSD